MKNLTLLFVLLLFGCAVYGNGNVPHQKINPLLLNSYWPASWIAYPGDSGLEYGVYHFRKTVDLSAVPDEYIIHVSADNRYQLYVNGQRVSAGPARGDLMHWYFETVDISEYLKPGKNILAAAVWNFSNLKPWAQHSNRTGFIVQGNGAAEQAVNSDTSWKVFRNPAYKPAGAGSETTEGQFVVVGPCDDVDGSKYPWGWESAGYDDSQWPAAAELIPGKPRHAGTGIEWGLEPRNIPAMETFNQNFATVRRSENIKVPEGFVAGNATLTIPANQKVVFLLDQGVLTTAYPELLVSGGQNAVVELKYAEALFDENGQKGNRDVVEGKKLIGYADYFRPDGGKDRSFRPLWLRTWRYLQVTVETSAQPLVITRLTSEFNGYPFSENATFISDDHELSEIWDTGWRTARLCAGETYFDCPYYEQMQYVGDTRIQALISLYVSGDDRLMRNALRLFDQSRFSEGLTMSRYPSSIPQVIPPYSLFWVDMVYDYWMHRDDPEFVKSFLNGIDQVMQFFIAKTDTESGLLGKTGYWNFVDWAEEWPWDNEKQIGGVPEGGFEGRSSILSLHLAYTAKHAAQLHKWAGSTDKADYYNEIANRLVKAVNETCFDRTRNYYANTPDKNEFSMHAQIFAVLAGAVPEEDKKGFVQRFKNDSQLIQPTMYFSFYLTQALKDAGLAGEYLGTLDLWRNMLKLGLTTFAEKPDPTRSDCHAWSASPNYDFLATVAGIEPASPGFKTVKIEPHLGSLNQINGSMPHPQGTIRFDLKRAGNDGISGSIELPGNLDGSFYWKEKKIPLKGVTKIDL